MPLEAGIEVPRNSSAAQQIHSYTVHAYEHEHVYEHEYQYEYVFDAATDPSSRTLTSYHLHGSGAIVVLRSTATTRASSAKTSK